MLARLSKLSGEAVRWTAADYHDLACAAAPVELVNVSRTVSSLFLTLWGGKTPRHLTGTKTVV